MSPSITPQPVEVRRISSTELPPHGGLAIEWADGIKQTLQGELVRTSCPCASCQEARGESNHNKPLEAKSSLLRVVKASAEESLQLVEIWGVGNYALGLRWGDGHDTGIFSYDLLRRLGEKAAKSLCHR